MSIHYRITPEGENLKKEDYRFGFGLDTSLYNSLQEERTKRGLQTRKDFTEDYDTRTGHNIEGKPFNTRYHPYQNLKLLEKTSGNIYVVDSVHKHHHMGYYIMLLIREENSSSHGIAYWENISCKDPNILEGITESHQRFEAIDTTKIDNIFLKVDIAVEYSEDPYLKGNYFYFKAENADNLTKFAIECIKLNGGKASIEKQTLVMNPQIPNYTVPILGENYRRVIDVVSKSGSLGLRYFDLENLWEGINNPNPKS